MNLSVVIPVYKQKEMFLDNLQNNIAFLSGCEIIIVDDASGEGIDKELKKFKQVKYLKNLKNQGFGQSVNKGVMAARHEYVMLLNSDVRLKNDSYKKAHKLLNQDNALFAVSFAQRQPDDSIVGKNTIFFKSGLIQHRAAYDKAFSPNAWAEGGASMLKKSYFKKLGGFENLYSPFYWEDIDLSYQAYKNGWQIIFDPEIEVDHKHESTIGAYFDKKAVMVVSYRNQFTFMWLNITDRLLLLLHMLSIPYLLLYHLSKGDRAFFIGFYQALSRKSEVKRVRKIRAQGSIVPDRKILNKFHE